MTFLTLFLFCWAKTFGVFSTATYAPLKPLAFCWAKLFGVFLTQRLNLPQCWLGFQKRQKLVYKSFFIVFLLSLGPKWALTQAICYDITNKQHQCSQKEPPQSSNNVPTNNTEETQKAHLRSITIEALAHSCPQSQAQASQNIVDIQKAIDGASLSDRENFICKQFVEISKQNAQVKIEREFMLAYIQKQQSNKAITDEDKVKMASLLIKYRLLENKKGVCSPYATGGACYFATTRFSAPEEMQTRIQNAAQNYVNRFGEPKGCVINGKRKNFTVCEEEIKSRVKAIPAPLVLAQITEESGWGESSWAKNYNNFLGLQTQFGKPKTMACYKNCRCAGEDQDRCAHQFQSMTGCLYEYYSRFNASSLKEGGYPQYREARNALTHQDDINTQCQNARELIPYLKYAENPNYQGHICKALNQNICQMIKKCPPFTVTAGKKV